MKKLHTTNRKSHYSCVVSQHSDQWRPTGQREYEKKLLQ